MSLGKVVLKKNLLTEDNITELNNRVNNFTPTEVPNDTGLTYYREHIEKDKFINFIDTIDSIIREEFPETPCDLIRIVINRVNNEYNKNDSFHRDGSYMSSVTLLNSDYKGGDFNYINFEDKDIKLKIDKYSTIIFNGKTTRHRILPVTEGNRYSLVTFWNRKKTKNKVI